jgi:hypothetical protein
MPALIVITLKNYIGFINHQQYAQKSTITTTTNSYFILFEKKQEFVFHPSTKPPPISVPSKKVQLARIILSFYNCKIDLRIADNEWL